MHYRYVDETHVKVWGEYGLSAPKGLLDPDRTANVTLNYEFVITLPEGLTEEGEDAYIGQQVRVRLGDLKKRFFTAPQRITRYAEKIVYGPYTQPEKPV